MILTHPCDRCPDQHEAPGSWDPDASISLCYFVTTIVPCMNGWIRQMK